MGEGVRVAGGLADKQDHPPDSHAIAGDSHPESN
jgi:hypothetical protein